MFKTIVLGLDGSDGAKRAIPFTVELARRDNARLVIAHVEQRVVGKGVAPIPGEDEIEAEIDRQAKELTEQGIDTRVEKSSTIFVGGPAVAIAEIADQADADLIIVGTRGHSAAIGVVLGSVAERLPHLAHQPVLVVPEHARVKGDGEGAASEGATA
jgi:nucleotide-binding universal stress UspA family protein